MSAREEQFDGLPGYHVPPDLPGHAILLPRTELPEKGISPRDAKRLIEHDLALDGNALLNLATFVTTFMEPEAHDLMATAFDKNMIDKDEYPQTAEIERRCIDIVTSLFHAPEPGVGTSAIGSSEAVMLCGMALKWVWRTRRDQQGKPPGRPNLVLGTNVQVVWQKFCRYWEVEANYIPVAEDRPASRCPPKTSSRDVTRTRSGSWRSSGRRTQASSSRSRRSATP